MIFAWGTGYKLSLYKVDAAAYSAPAKVCTRGSDAAKSAIDHAADRPNAIQIPVLVAALFTIDNAVETDARGSRRQDPVIDRSPLNRAPILYLRPPPREGSLLD
jgi:hypothetical protein